jgi:hypothetical protein
MKSIAKFLMLLGISWLLSGCMKTETPAENASAQTQIRQKIADLYTKHGKSSDSIYSQAIGTDLFSADLENLLQQVLEVSKADQERIAKSEYPTDKPAILEGSVFSSLYEGPTGYSIQSIEMAESVKPLGTQATVRVAMENTSVSPPITWTDSVHLVNVFDSGWRVSNISFAPEMADAPDLVSNLQTFISHSQRPLP